MNISGIKLIIWDLDETFWEGVLSDNTVEILNENVQLIKNLTDCGVINSICSKNDYEKTKAFLVEHDLWDYFVFASVNWSQKGERVRQIISEMNLRDANVLFIDDNHLNLQEVKQFCPNIMVEFPTVIPELIEYFNSAPKKDIKHDRLNQYKILEEKKNFRATSSSNEEFLFNCNIKVDIKQDCTENADRIFDLVQRSNQLNFTKVRSTKEELVTLFEDENVQTGYVCVNDKFGDYGIVGFYAIENDVCRHFVFSCRTLNMGIEQYVYNLLGKPTLTVVGEVASSLTLESPTWINQDVTQQKGNKSKLQNSKMLIKGPCDLELVFSFIEDNKNIVKEFVYVGKNGVSIESAGHTEHIVSSLSLDNATKQRLIDQLPFGDKNMFHTAMFDKDIGVVFLSMFTDPNLGLYKEKSSGAVVAFGEWTNDLTDPKLWAEFIEQKRFTANCKFTHQSLEFIRDNYEFIGRITPERVIKNLDFIYSHISSNTKLVLNLGSEIAHENNCQEAYKDRHIYHKTLNNLIKSWKKDKPNVFVIEVSKYIFGQDDYTNNINHFAKSVYYKIAQEIIEIVNDKSLKVRKKQKSALVRKIKKLSNRIVGFLLKR